MSFPRQTTSMKSPFRFLIATCACAVGLAVAQTAENPEPPDAPSPSKKTQKVTKLDGTTLFGIVTLTDDYTLKISNESGIFNVPLALLGEKDFKKFIAGKDRSRDGRLWSERQDALEKQKEANEKEGGSRNKAATDNSSIEIQLSEIAVFQPVITAYEATLGNRLQAAGTSASGKEATDGKKSSDDTRPVRLFSGPSANSLPYSGVGSGLVDPVISAGTSVLQPAGGVPSVPVSVPGAP